VDFSDYFTVFNDLVVSSKFIANSVIGINILSVYDGGAKCLELDLFYDLVVDWLGNLFWLQPKKQ
jgi:hypothetical protein